MLEQVPLLLLYGLWGWLLGCLAAGLFGFGAAVLMPDNDHQGWGCRGGTRSGARSHVAASVWPPVPMQ